jgi:hypothetical protein
VYRALKYRIACSRRVDLRPLACSAAAGLFCAQANRSKYAINNRAQGTAEENKATAQGTITYFGTYSVSETDSSISIQVVSSSFPNWIGADQKRIVALTASTGGGTTEVVFTRAK